GAVGRAVFTRLTARAGASGLDDGVWTNWDETAADLPEKLRAPIQILKLAYMRESLFANNLVRPYADGSKTGFWETPDGPPDWARHWRTADGSWNDLRRDADGRYDPMIGAAYTRFFRNVGDGVGLEAVRPRSEPATNPVSVRELSRQLLAPTGPRKEVPFLNLWAAAWIQFMVHDWVSHGTPDYDRLDRVPLADDDPLRRYGIETLDLPTSRPDPTRAAADGDRPPTTINEVTHWWDGSQLYGSDPDTQRALRSGTDGKLRLTDDGLLPIDPATGVEQTGFVRNWWLGLATMHTVFAREHNAICDHLRERYDDWDDERLFQTARLVNAAVMAKIHTVEWTPAILANRTLHDAMHANWYGLLTSWFGGEHPHTVEPIPIASHELGGIVGGPQGTFARYGLSEEFTAVYRMHSLLPDAFQLLRVDAPPLAIPLLRTRGAAVGPILREHGLEAVAASMGAQSPGALVNNNFPAALLDLTVPHRAVVDLGALDLYRDRERGVPRYNQLRVELGLERVPSFDVLTDDADTVARLRACYGVDAGGHDRIDDMDLLIGTLCESHRPHGFGFGETLFQVFILNASWRLLGDRFYTSDYRPEIYTQEGLDWVDQATMKSVLLRHMPLLDGAGLGNVRNAFEPWDEGELDPARHPTRAFDKELADDPWSGERARERDGS
ncbi:MAG TPA: peroxidase family protein, partial [Kofleriaceae bacterium]|nr:peroxidase family protein [Kofleriaceae bacterium]